MGPPGRSWWPVLCMPLPHRPTWATPTPSRCRNDRQTTLHVTVQAPRCKLDEELAASRGGWSVGHSCICFVLVWAKHRISLPYAKSDRQKRSSWSRMAEAKVREDSQHNPTVGVHCSRFERLFSHLVLCKSCARIDDARHPFLFRRHTF